MSNPQGEPHVQRAAGSRFLAWFPWEKTLIWGLFLLAVYALRHFFFIIFMTFMLTYIMSNVVKRVTGLFSPHVERAWLQRVVSVIGFLVLIGCLYGVGAFLYRPLKTQATGLVQYARTVNIESIFNELLRRTIGAWKFESEYGGKAGEKKMAEELEKEQGTLPIQAFAEFPNLVSKIQQDFHKHLVETEGKNRFAELQADKRDELAFNTWLRDVYVEKKFVEEGEKRINDWNANKESRDSTLWVNLPTRQRMTKEGMTKERYVLTKQYEADRDETIKLEIYNNLHQNKEAHLEEFKNHLGEEVFGTIEKEGKLEERFAKYYSDLKAKPPPLTAPLLDYDLFVQLKAAMRDRQAFERILLGDYLSPEDRAKRVQETFRRKKELKFVSDLQDKEEYAFLQLDNVKKRLAEWVPEFTKWLTGIGVGIFQFMVQFALSLLLSFFITFDMPRLRRGVRQLETSRISDFYLEIAPGLINFGRLIGRAFQAQGVIAICNTILTLLVLKLPAIVGTGPAIQNEVFLCSIVFLCSFIPVLGVVFSSVPIAVMAIIQPEGSIMLAIYAIVGILAVHFIETSILNPKILGDMLHLHPVMVLGILAMGEYFFGVWGLLLGVPVAVYVIRYVILAEDMHLPLSLQSSVARLAGIREVPPRPLLGTDEPQNTAPDLPSKAPPEPVGAGKPS